MNSESNLICGTMRFTSWGSNFSCDQAEEFIIHCLDNGITVFDTADIYGNNNEVEKLLGQVFTKNPELRKRIKIITKCGIVMKSDTNIKYYDSSTQYILSSVARSLTAMNTDYIDMLLIHRPDPYTNPSEIANAFEELKNSKSVLSFGVSNYLPSQLSSLYKKLKEKSIKLETNQIEFNPFNLTHMFNGTFDYLMEKNIRPQIWSPLAGGKIFDLSLIDPIVIRIRETLQNLSVQYNTTIECLILAWISHHPSKPDIVIGTTRKEKVIELLKHSEIKLKREDWFKILEGIRGVEVD